MDTRAVLILVLLLHFLVSLSAPLESPALVVEAIRSQLVLLVPLFLLGALWLFAVVAWRRSQRPARALRSLIWRQRDRYLEGTFFVLALAAMMQIYMVLKVAIPTYVPFYADPYLARLDALLFGRDAWTWTHALFGPTATRMLDVVYGPITLAVTAGTTLWICYSRDRTFSRSAVLATTLCWFVLGNWAALLLSSAGPVYVEHFYGDPRFASLVGRLPPDLTVVLSQAYLLEGFDQPGFGKGISAAPSMHNAAFILLALFVHDRWGRGWQFGLAVILALAIWIASVHLAWHYAVDGLLSAMLVPPIWYAAKRIERWRVGSVAGCDREPGLAAA